MTYKNTGKEKSDIIQNHFTAYVTSSVEWKRREYLSDLADIWRNEISAVDGDMVDLEAKIPSEATYQDMEGIHTGNKRLDNILDQLNDRDIRLLIGLLVLNEDYDMLTAELGISKSAAYTAYHRMMRRIRRELGIEE